MTLTFLGRRGGDHMVLRETEYERGGGEYGEMTANEKGSSEYYGAIWGIREYSS